MLYTTYRFSPKKLGNGWEAWILKSLKCNIKGQPFAKSQNLNKDKKVQISYWISELNLIIPPIFVRKYLNL